jgi:hypothetical protein
MQQLGNENKRFQLQLQANSAIGDIMSTSPSLEEGLAKVSQSPYAAYASEYLKNMRDMQSALASSQKTELETNSTAMQAYTKSLAPLYQANLAGAGVDELRTLADGAMRQAVALSPPGRAAKTHEIISAINSTLFDGLPADNAQAGVTFGRRLSNVLATSGMGAPEYANLVGKPTMIDDGLNIHTGMEVPGFGFVPSGQVIPRQLAPGATVPAGQVPQGAQPDQGTGLMGPSGGTLPMPPRVRSDFAPSPVPNQLAPPTPVPTPATPAPPAPSATPAPSVGAQPPQAVPPPSEVAADGKPLVAPDTNVVGPAGQLEAGRGPARRFQFANKTDENLSQKLSDEFAGKDLSAYRSSSDLMSQLDYMDNAVNHLANSAFLEPGALADARLQFARGWNTVTDIAKAAGYNVGPESQFDKGDIASMEDLLKSSVRSQFTWLTSTLGVQREAAMTIATAGRGVPGIENSVLGNKLLIETARAAVDRSRDLYKFQQWWLQQPQSHGSLVGSEVEFNRQHSVSDMTNGVLSKFGLTDGGFKTKADIDRAHNNNWIDDNMAGKAAQNLYYRDHPEAKPQR